MYAGLFKQNCDWSWITAAIVVAGVDTWRRVTSRATNFRRTFQVFTTVRSFS